MPSVGVRELRQNLSRFLDRVKDGEVLTVTEHGRTVARLVPAGPRAEPYRVLAEQFGATVPTGRIEDIAAEMQLEPHPAGTAEALLAEGRGERLG